MNTSFNYHSFMNDIHGKVKSVLDAEYLRVVVTTQVGMPYSYYDETIAA